jgi:Fur family zinc uptake transcriptional regulator
MGLLLASARVQLSLYDRQDGAEETRLNAETCRHGVNAKPGAEAIAGAVAEAEARCAAAGESWTVTRARVYELLLAASGPVKAYDLMSGFGADGKAASPPTIYRALEFLQTLGLAHRIPSLNAFVACGLDGHLHAAAFLICDCCGTVAEFAPDADEAAAAIAARHDFRVDAISIELRGRCGSCA